jgi:RNA polymerase sigma factor (sigma-70 family)
VNVDAPLRPFEEIVAEHGPAVMRVCRALLAPADAADAWSETFLAALRAYPQLRPGKGVRGWLITIAQRKAVDHARAGARRPRPSGLLPELPGEACTGSRRTDSDREELRAALHALPEKQRGAVIHRYLAELSYAEVGALLDCSAVAARRNAADGIAKLRRHYLKGTKT